MFQEIHWYEGQFLQPHVFQRFQHGVLELVAAQRRLGGCFPYGVVAMELSDAALGQFKVEITRLHAIMPGGLEIGFQAQPGAAGVAAGSNTLLSPLDLKPALAGDSRRASVHLAVPRWAAERADCIDLHRRDVSPKTRYDFYDVDCQDENTGQNSKPVRLRRIRARLMLGDEDRSDYETLELLRVRSAFSASATASVPQRDADFIPPLFSVAASPRLCQALLELLHDIATVRDELSNRIRNAGHPAANLLPSDFLNVLSLQTLEGALGRLRPLVQAVVEGQVIAPFHVYRELQGYNGELGALQAGLTGAQPKRASLPETYRHDDSWPCFDLVIQQIRDRLPKPDPDRVLTGDFQLVPGRPDEHIVELTAEHAEHVARTNAWYLGVRSNQDATKLSEYVKNADRFRLLPASYVQQGILVPGLALSQPRHVPTSLPGHPDIQYFLLDIPNSPAGRWDLIVRERWMAISRTGSPRDTGVDLSGAQFTLYVTLPPGSRPGATTP